MSIKYKFEICGDTKYLVYTHKDGMKIYGLSVAGLIETVTAYQNIYYRGV